MVRRKAVKNRNPIARVIRKLGHKVVPSKKLYKRKGRLGKSEPKGL